MDFLGRFCPRGFVLISVCSETTFFQGIQRPSTIEFFRLDLLTIKYGFPGSVLPQRVRINLRLLWNDVFQGFQRPSKIEFFRLDLLTIKYGFPGSVLPQRVRINLRLLWNNVFSRCSKTLKHRVFQTGSFDHQIWISWVGFTPEGSY